MTQRNQHMALITYPSRTMIIGRSRMGKTTIAVKILQHLQRHVKFWFFVCPSLDQKVFDPVRHLFRPGCVFTKPSGSSMAQVVTRIEALFQEFRRKGLDEPSIGLFFDDVSGTSAIHGGGKGMFSNYATRITHLGASMVVIGHKPTDIDPSYRNNAENVVVFPSEAKSDETWLIENFGTNSDPRINIREAIALTWGGQCDQNPIWGKHFLFIHREPRSRSRFFIDFDQEI